MEYELGIRLDMLEAAVRELQEKIFPERFEEDKPKPKKAKRETV